MIDTKNYIESLLMQYFYNLEMFERKVKEIENITYTIMGVHAISYDSIKGGSEERDKKLVRYSEKIRPLETQKKHYKLQADSLYQSLNLVLLDDIDYTVLENIYRYKKTYEEIAISIGYNDKSYIARKKEKIINKLVDVYERRN